MKIEEMRKALKEAPAKEPEHFEASERDAPISELIRCPWCAGTGRAPDPRVVSDCSACLGSGLLLEERKRPNIVTPGDFTATDWASTALVEDDDD